MAELPPVTVDRTLDPYTLTVVDEVLVGMRMNTKWASEARLINQARAAIQRLGDDRDPAC